MNVKKLISMVLALVMLLAMSATAMAYTITAPNNGHTYEVYQIFIGDLNDAGVLTNIKWGLNGTGTQNQPVDQTILDGLDKIDDDASDVEKLNVIRQYANLTSTPYGKLGEMKDAETNETEFVEKLQSVPSGYYLIKDEEGSLTGEHEAYTLYIVQIVDNVTIRPKADVPEFEKKVDDENDSIVKGPDTPANDKTHEDDKDWQDSADYDIGDAVPFQLTATLPENYSAYTRYKLVFHDTMTNMGNVQITDAYLANPNGDKIASFTANEEKKDYILNEAEGSFTVTFANLKTSSIAAQIQDSYKIVVEYTAVLSDSANIGAAGNPNTAYLEFSNNPNYTGNGDKEPTGETPVDKVIVFTYKVIVDKVTPKLDSNGDPVKVDNKVVYEDLPGAGFTLYKKDAKTDEYNPVGEELTGNQMVKFEWKGLDDGDYKIVETTVPDGYNKVNDILFTITATHDITSDNPALTGLSGSVASGEVTFTADTAAGSLTTSVVNQKGATLPETGAQGTKMLYIVGGILVAAAVVLLIVKRRMDSAE